MTQTQSILAYLQTGRSLSPLIALERFGCMRLAARIRDLRAQGYKVETHRVKFGNKSWASYLLDRA